MERNAVAVESPLFVDSVFFQLRKKTESTKSGDPVFYSQHFLPPHLSVSELKFSDSSLLSLPLICWSQAFGYGFLASYGIIICTLPNFLKTLLQKRAT